MPVVPADSLASDLREKLVLDWNNFALGKVHAAQRDPKTNLVRTLVVSLSREAQHRMGAPSQELVIPVHMVFGIRRSEVTLDRSIDEIGRLTPVPEPVAELPF